MFNYRARNQALQSPIRLLQLPRAGCMVCQERPRAAQQLQLWLRVQKLKEAENAVSRRQSTELSPLLGQRHHSGSVGKLLCLLWVRPWQRLSVLHSRAPSGQQRARLRTQPSLHHTPVQLFALFSVSSSPKLAPTPSSKCSVHCEQTEQR